MDGDVHPHSVVTPEVMEQNGSCSCCAGGRLADSSVDALGVQDVLIEVARVVGSVYL
jgi:hypothetical protein